MNITTENDAIPFIRRIPDEWPGLKPCKWKGNKKVIRPIDNNPFNPTSRIELKMRRHFSAKVSEEIIFRPGLKLFTETKFKTNIEDKPRGLKAINPNFTENKFYFEKRHYDTITSNEKTQEPFHIKTFQPDGNFRTTNEFTLEHNLQKKTRIMDLDSLRNGLISEIPGNKCFKYPEYSADFFKEGGLIPGSTNTLNFKRSASKKSNNFYDTLNLAANSLDPNKLWHNKIKKENFLYDDLFVKSLSQWDNKVLKLKELKKMENKTFYKVGGNANISSRNDNKKQTVKADRR